MIVDRERLGQFLEKNFLIQVFVIVMVVGRSRAPVGMVPVAWSRRVREGWDKMGLARGAATMPFALSWLMM